MVCHVFQQNGDEPTTANQRRSSGTCQLANNLTSQNGTQLHRFVISAEGRIDRLILHPVTNPYPPGNHAAITRPSKGTTAMCTQFVKAERYSMLA